MMILNTDKQRGVAAVIAAIAIQLTLGVAYIWSVFQTGIANSIFRGDNADAGLVFSLLLATLTIGSVIGGKLAVRFSTRLVVLTGGLILSAGFLLASFVTADYYWALWVTYGVMGGVGMGFTYSPTIACAQKWYPHRKGLVTGIIVASLGFGGVVFTPIVEMLITHFGGEGTLEAAGGEQGAFRVLSAVFLIVCTIGSLFLKNPPDGYMADAPPPKGVRIKAYRDYSPGEMLRNPKFYVVTIAFMLSVMGGLMLINFARPIAVAKNMGETAMYGVLAVSLFQSAGRLLWGMASDRFGRKNTITLMLAVSAVLSLIVIFAQGYWIFVVIGCIGFFYGGILSTFPSLTADLFGAKHMATNYGFVLLGFGAGAILASQIAGYYRDLAGDDIEKMLPAFIIGACCAAAGIGLMFILRVINKRMAAKVINERG
jgi:OFA family oxalate/formate antiporter-like MFS transporter